MTEMDGGGKTVQRRRKGASKRKEEIMFSQRQQSAVLSCTKPETALRTACHFHQRRLVESCNPFGQFSHIGRSEPGHLLPLRQPVSPADDSYLPRPGPKRYATVCGHTIVCDTKQKALGNCVFFFSLCQEVFGGHGDGALVVAP